MSMLLRFVRSQGIKNRVSLAQPKDQKICGVAQQSNSSVTKSEKKDTYKVKPTWVSYGFDYEDKKTDRHFMHQTTFVLVSICLVCGGLILGYAPDPLLRDWAKREAYLRLRYREENGLPLIDRNLVDPSKFSLPTDEELGFTEIII